MRPVLTTPEQNAYVHLRGHRATEESAVMQVRFARHTDRLVTDAHLEFTSGGSQSAPPPHPETLLVLYLGSPDVVDEICRRVGSEQVEAVNPYWSKHAVTLADPDGFRVVLVARAAPKEPLAR